MNTLIKTIPLSIASIMLVTGCSVEPKPLVQNEIREALKKDLLSLNQDEKILKPISLEDAIFRGLKYNRNKRVKIMESALAQKQLDLLKYDMLPTLTTNAGYSIRDSYSASASTSFTDGQPNPLDANPSYSVSQDKDQNTADITFSWNVLDFGLSYVRAKQQSDRFLIAKEQTRKVTHNMTQEIRRAYYQAVSSEELLKKIHPLMKEVKEALEDTDKVKKLRLKSPMEALIYQRELLDVLRDLNGLKKTLIFSKVELAELMGLKPNTKYELAEKIKNSYEIPPISFRVPTMEKIALENRSEILESRYKERITDKELSIVMLKMLPGITIDAGYNYNDSKYLLDNDWYGTGANVTWNLLNIFKYSYLNDTAEAKILLAKEQKLALCLAVITQVNLSNIRFNQAVDEYKLSKQYLNVAQEIYTQALNARKVDMNSNIIIIKEKLSHFLATLRHSSAYASMQNSYGRMYASMGIHKDSDVEYEKDNLVQMEEKVILVKEEINEEDVLIKIENITRIPIVENIPMIVNTPIVENIPIIKNTPKVKMVETKTSILDIDDKKIPNTHILLTDGDKLKIKGKEYIVKKGDTISELSIKSNEKIKTIIRNNIWLVEQNRIRFK